MSASAASKKMAVGGNRQLKKISSKMKMAAAKMASSIRKSYLGV
jgi:hypothetical protein